MRLSKKLWIPTGIIFNGVGQIAECCFDRKSKCDYSKLGTVEVRIFL